MLDRTFTGIRHDQPISGEHGEMSGRADIPHSEAGDKAAARLAIQSAIIARRPHSSHARMASSGRPTCRAARVCGHADCGTTPSTGPETASTCSVCRAARASTARASSTCMTTRRGGCSRPCAPGPSPGAQASPSIRKSSRRVASDAGCGRGRHRDARWRSGPPVRDASGCDDGYRPPRRVEA